MVAIKKYQGRKADVTSFSTPKGKKKSVSPSKATGLRLSASDNDDLTSDDEVVLTSAKKKALSSHANRVSSNTDYEEEVEEEAWPETQGLSSRNELFDALDADAYRYVLSRLDVDSATDSTDVLRNTFESSPFYGESYEGSDLHEATLTRIECGRILLLGDEIRQLESRSDEALESNLEQAKYQIDMDLLEKLKEVISILTDKLFLSPLLDDVSVVNVVVDVMALSVFTRISAGVLPTSGGPPLNFTRKKAEELVSTIMKVSSLPSDNEEFARKMRKRLVDRIALVKKSLLEGIRRGELADEDIEWSRIEESILGFAKILFNDANNKFLPAIIESAIASQKSESPKKKRSAPDQNDVEPFFTPKAKRPSLAGSNYSVSPSIKASQGSVKKTPSFVDKPRSLVTRAEATPALVPKRPFRVRFTEDETETLSQGIRRFGYSWMTILKTYPIFKEHGRTHVDLKDKARNMIIRLKREGNDYSDWENPFPRVKKTIED